MRGNITDDAVALTRRQGLGWSADRLPRSQSKIDPATASGAFVHTRLHGTIGCTAYSIGPVSVRLGNVTLILIDRAAALTLVSVFLYFGEAVERLGAPVPQSQPTGTRPAGLVAAVIEMTGPQTLRDLTVTVGPDGRPEASITVGQVRITASDRQAAATIATAAGEAYDIACHTHAGLKPMQQWRHRHTIERIVDAPRL